MDFVEQQDFVRNIKGAAASILWILVLSGRTLTNRELQRATRYSDKPVTDALVWLEEREIVQYHGHYNGWSLAAGIKQLPLPFELPLPVDNFLEAGPEIGIIPNSRPRDRNNSDLLHDHDHDDQHDLVMKVVEKLAELGFDEPESWLADVRVRLVWQWLEFYESLTTQRRKTWRNPPALIRSAVESGRRPPRRRRKKTAVDLEKLEQEGVIKR